MLRWNIELLCQRLLRLTYIADSTGFRVITVSSIARQILVQKAHFPLPKNSLTENIRMGIEKSLRLVL